MRLPHAEFTIGQQAIHTNSGLTGTIAGIRRHDETLQYLFDCAAFKQWLSIGKLEHLNKTEVLNEDSEIEYKVFDVSLLNMREVETLIVSVRLTDELAYEQSFTAASANKAMALYDFIQVQDAITESLLFAVGLEVV